MKSWMHILCLIFVIYMTMNHIGEASKMILVGGSFFGWGVPKSANNTLNHWAESVRFEVGDTLAFYFDFTEDSVLQVTKENYESCNTKNPLREYIDEGKPKVTLNVSGPYYFISGAKSGNCGKGEKLMFVAQTPKPGPGPVSTPSPTPSSPTVPAPAPAPAKNSAVGMVFGNGLFGVNLF